MFSKLSDDLITISTMMMVAKERGEIISLANDLNTAVLKAMEIEKAKSCKDTIDKKAISTSIKFTKQEIDKMSKTFKKEFIANGCVAHIIKRPSGKNGVYYEIRYRRNGFNLTVSNKDIHKAKELFIEATKNIESPSSLAKKALQFGTIVKEWLEYKRGKVTDKTLKDYTSRAERYITEDLKKKLITEIHTNDLDNLMNYKAEPRKYEEIRSLFSQIFKYATASGIITHNPVTIIPFKRAERNNREALTEEQLKIFLKRIREPEFESIRQASYVLYFFGLRPCELDDKAHFEDGFLICRNRKRKGGKIEYKKIPIPVQAQGLIDFSKPITLPLCYSKSLDIFKKIVSEDVTFYNLRHTFASICSEYVRPDIVDVWMGDSPERLVQKVYVHFKDEFMIAQMKKVKFPT